MDNFELITFSDPGGLARAAAEAWLKELLANERSDLRYSVALAGGRIASRFFSEVVMLAKKDKTSFKSVNFFWGDERCVPPNDPESNYRLAREHLLDPLTIPVEQTHRIRGEHPPELAAKDAEKELCSLIPATAAGQPILDLVFLGIGEEGHVASLFPGEAPEVMNSQRVYRAVTATKPPPQRITLGYPAIAAARQVWVLASGQGKEGAFRDSLSGKARTPFAHVLGLREHTKIFSDLA